MQGLPKFYATKADLDNVRTDFGDDTYKAELQKLYDGRLIWGNDVVLAEGNAGVVDATHRVLENRDLETGVVSHIQQELVVDPNAYIFTRLGFTDGEVLAMLG